MHPVTMLRKRLAHSSRLFVWSAAGGGLLLLLVFFLSVAWDSYRNRVAASRQTVANIAALIAQDIARNLALYDLSLQAVIDGVADPEVMAQPQLKTRWFALRLDVDVAGAQVSETALVDAQLRPAKLVARTWGEDE